MYLHKKLAFSDDKRLQTWWNHLISIWHSYWKSLLSEIDRIHKEKLNIIINFDVILENRREHNPHWPQIRNHPCRLILIVGGSESRKMEVLLNLINFQRDIKSFCMLSIHRKEAGLKHFKDPKLLLNTQVIWMMFTKVFNSTLQERNEKYW